MMGSLRGRRTERESKKKKLACAKLRSDSFSSMPKMGKVLIKSHGSLETCVAQMIHERLQGNAIALAQEDAQHVEKS